jgi:hypothetical protein
VMPYSVYQQYQAERVKTDAERREADKRQGVMAAEVSRLWQDVTRPLGALFRSSARRSPATRPARPGYAAR